MRAARRVCTNVKLKHHARKPGKAIDIKAVKADAAEKMKGYNEARVRTLNGFTAKSRVNMEVVIKRLGQTNIDTQEWLILTPKDKIPKPEKEAFPRPPKRPDGSYIYERVPPTAAAVSAASITQQVILRPQKALSSLKISNTNLLTYKNITDKFYKVDTDVGRFLECQILKKKATFEMGKQSQNNMLVLLQRF